MANAWQIAILKGAYYTLVQKLTCSLGPGWHSMVGLDMDLTTLMQLRRPLVEKNQYKAPISISKLALRHLALY